MQLQQEPRSVLLPSGVYLECLDDDSDAESMPESQSELFAQSQDSIQSDSPRTTLYNGLAALSCQPEFMAGRPVPRSVTPNGFSETSSESSQMDCVTPVKPENNNPELDPLTPTANLKMLISAASPEIRNRDKLKESFHQTEAAIDECDDMETVHVCIESMSEDSAKPSKKASSAKASPSAELDEESSGPATSRKEKSLGLLCQRFLARYPECPPSWDTLEISLDEAAKDLCVERRRIYDIVNVLESVEIVSRLAKNRYTWHGKTNLKHTLAKLKALAVLEGFGEVIEKIRQHELSRELRKEDKGKKGSAHIKEPLKFNDECNLKTEAIRENLRKDKSLGIMSQKFLMLFLVSRNKTVNLDLSAKILIGDPNVDTTETGKFKTKIRRLYDIANILTSLELIRKVQVTEVRGRKPAFKYIGPCIDDVSDIPACSGDGFHRPSTRHSMLDCVQNPNVCNMLTTHSHVSCGTEGAVKAPGKKPFARHSSLDQICLVAEQERTRLNMESRSQSSSPSLELLNTASENIPVAAATSKQGASTQLVTQGMFKQLVLLRSSPATGSSGGVSVQRLPLSIQQPSSQASSQKQPAVFKLNAADMQYVIKSMTPSGAPTLVASKPDTPGAMKGMVSIVNRDGSVYSQINAPQVKGAKTRLQIVRVHPNEAAATVRGKKPEGGVKRPRSTDLPSDGAQCYFNAKRARTEEPECLPEGPSVKQRPAPRALNFDAPAKVSPRNAQPSRVSPCHTTSGVGRSEGTSPTLLLNSSTAPVMLLPSPVTTTVTLPPATSSVVTSATQYSSPLHLVNATSLVSPGSLAIPQFTPLSSSNVISPQFTSLSSSVISPQFMPLSSSNVISPQFTPLSASNVISPQFTPLSSAGLVSLQPTVVTSTVMDTTPVGIPGSSLRVLRSIPPTNAILNLGPHLMADSEFDHKRLARQVLPLAAQPTAKLVPNLTLDPSSLARVSAPPACSDGEAVLTPRDRIITSEMLSTLMNTTPSSAPSLTPTSFFRSTPGGLPSASTAQPLRVSGAPSAFHVLNPSVTAPNDGLATARRLELLKPQLMK